MLPKSIDVLYVASSEMLIMMRFAASSMPVISPALIGAERKTCARKSTLPRISSALPIKTRGGSGFFKGSGAFSILCLGKAPPYTSSSSVTPNSVLILHSLSSSGCAKLFSHLDTDWRDTSSALAKSP